MSEMFDKFYLKEVCGEYKFYEKGDNFPLTEKQILNKLNENNELKKHIQELSDYIEELRGWDEELDEWD